MVKEKYKYIIIGAGVAGLSAIEGIREHDKDGSILLIGKETYPPYQRPPLSKDLWWGTSKPEELFIHDEHYYEQNGADLLLGATAVSLDAGEKTLTDDNGRRLGYEKLLLATGGAPRTLPIPGGKLEGICYYRYLDDYKRLSGVVSNGSSVMVIGGGFIGSELGASMSQRGANVTMLFPDTYVCAKVLPEYIGKTLNESFINHGVMVLSEDKPVAFEKSGDKFITRTQKGNVIETDAVAVGIGIAASVGLAEMAGIKIGRNITVDEYQQTSLKDVFAAGDNTDFPYLALGRNMHIEHWNHSINHGKWAGRNMAGAQRPYDYVPNFFSSIFDFNYDAVGEIDPGLRNIARWEKENSKGVVYFMREDRLCGVLTCNMANGIDWARELIKQGAVPSDLAGAVR